MRGVKDAELLVQGASLDRAVLGYSTLRLVGSNLGSTDITPVFGSAKAYCWYGPRRVNVDP